MTDPSKWGEARDVVEIETTLTRAKAGDADAFRELTERHRRELRAHCYRIVGSLEDAEDLVQETLLAAWRGLDRFEARSSLRAWLYRIATNRCLNALRASGRRPREVHTIPELPEPTRRIEPSWLEPFPDALLEEAAANAPGPEARFETRETIGLAFVTALQQLPPQQRVVFVLRDVLGFRAAEVADMLDTTRTAVKSALQRARESVQTRQPSGVNRETAPLPRSAREQKLVGAFAAAVEAGDIDAVVSLLTEDARITMPPLPYEYQGHTAIAAFLNDRARLRGRALRLVPTRANSQPAFGCYLPDPHTAIAHHYGLMVITLAGDRVSAITWFGDSSMFPRFGLPRTLRD